MRGSKVKKLEKFQPKEAWILWNPKSMQFKSDFYPVPILYHDKVTAEGAITTDPSSMLNRHWKALKVRVIPVRRRRRKA